MNKALRAALWLLCLASAGQLACRLLTERNPGGGSQGAETSVQRATAMVEPDQETSLALEDGASLVVPPGAVQTRTTVSLRRLDGEVRAAGPSESAVPASPLYEVDLGEQGILMPARLALPFDPDRLSRDVSRDQVFIAYYDDELEEWRFVGGTVDGSRDVVSVYTDHASKWGVFAWNWKAWIAALNKALSGNLLDILEAVELLTEECSQGNQAAHVDSSRSRNIIQGCIDGISQTQAELRIINPKSFFVEIGRRSGGADYFANQLLAPGESIRIAADLADPSPLVVTGEMTQEAGWRLIVHMMITMLPGANQIGIQGKTVACITERVADASYFFAAAENLAEFDGLAASEHLTHFMLDEEAAARFLKAADDCDYGPARTWSVAGLKQIGGSVSTIMSATDLIANYLAGNGYAELSFSWEPVRIGLDQLQACIDQGYVCMPLLVDDEGAPSITPLPREWGGLIYLIQHPGAIVYAPFDGEVYLFADGGSAYMSVSLPDRTRSILLEFRAGGIELQHQYDRNDPYRDTATVRAGDPILSYQGSSLDVQADLVPYPRVIYGTEFPPGTVFGFPIDFGTSQ